MSLQQQIQDVADRLVAAGAETGMQVAVDHQGARVVDVVAGVADRTTGRAVAANTLFFSFSAAKGVAALIAHLLVAHASIGYDTRVATVWPEFAARGKETATLRHVLTHTIGLPAMPGGLGPSDLRDWPRVCQAIADAEPLWRPGTRTGYHSYTFGFLVGEIARRLTGMTMGQLVHEWVAVPLGITGEVCFGVPAAARPGMATLEDADSLGTPPEHESILAPWERQPRASMGNSPDIVGADIPSVGSVTARGIATVYAAMLDGRLITDEQLSALSTTAFEGIDEVFGSPARLTLGYPLGRIGAADEAGRAAFGWPGGGGSYAYADPGSGTSFAVTKNRLTPDFSTAQRLSDIVASALGSRSVSRSGTNPVEASP